MTAPGIDDPFEEFWALFGAELDEYLTAIETILAASPVDPARVDELFRAFHSVKGGSAALGLRCIETVAHAAEDVLHLVRSGRKTLTTAVVSALLAAVDEMRRLQGTAMATRRDQPVNDAVVALLKSHRGEDGGKGGGEDGAAVPPVPPFPDLSSPPISMPVSQPVPVPAGFALTIGDDALTALQDAVLGLIGVIDGDPGEAGGVLADAADAAGLAGVAAAARRLAGSGDLRWSWVDLVMRLRAAEAASGGSVGAFALSAALEVPFADLLLEQVGVLKAEPADPAGWLHAQRLCAALDLDAAVELADLVATRLLLGEDAGDVDEIADLFALAGISGSSGMEMPCDEFAALRDARFAGAGLAPPADDVPADGVHAWPADVLARLAETVSAGGTAALLLLDLESDPHAVDAVSEIVHAERCLYNRSRLDLGGGLFEYLLAPADAAALARRLSDADPDHRCLRSVRPADATAAPGPEALSGSAPSLPAARPPAVAASAIPAETAPVPPATPPAAPSGASARTADTVVRVPSAAIDGFMDLIGELRLGLTSLGLLLDGEAAGGRRATADAMRRLDRAVRSLYDGALSLRVVPIGTLFSRLLRPIRDTAVLVGKEVALTTAGDDVQVDKAMIEMLVDPLTHIVRNSVDHGIEAPESRLAAGKPREGAIRIAARQGASHAVIEVEDDGGGIDVGRVRDKAVAKGLIGAAEAAALGDEEATQLILLPGFSTRDEVTATSGRGVGMDIVLTAIKKLGGRLSIASRPGAGTRMTIEFPISVAMQRVLSTELCGQTIAVQERAVQEVLQIAHVDLQRLGPGLALSLRGRFLPVVDLAALLGLKDGDALPDAGGDGRAVVLVLDNGEAPLGLLVERLTVRREVFFKRMHPLIERNPLIAGAAVIGAGTVMFALDTQALFAAALTAQREELACFAE